MLRTGAFLLGCLGFLAACKGETVVRDSPAVLAKLESCTRSLAEKDSLKQAYEKRIAELEMQQSGQAVTVTFEGDLFSVKTTKSAGNAPPVDEKVAAKLSEDFFKQVAGARGAIQKCYEQALKKNSGLQARTVTLRLSAKFAPSGEFQNLQFTPSLGETFGSCLQSVASKWHIGSGNQSMTFVAPVSLTPA
jgi:hypothetical protein